MRGGFYRQAFLAAALFPLVLGRSRVKILHLLWHWIHVIILYRHHASFHFPRREPFLEPVLCRGRRQYCVRFVHFHPSYRAGVENATLPEEEDRSPVHFPDCVFVSAAHIQSTNPQKSNGQCCLLPKNAGPA